jgi:hypothetical protein
VAESCTICSSRSGRPVRKLLDTPSYLCCHGMQSFKHFLDIKTEPVICKSRDSSVGIAIRTGGLRDMIQTPDVPTMKQDRDICGRKLPQASSRYWPSIWAEGLKKKKKNMKNFNPYARHFTLKTEAKQPPTTLHGVITQKNPAWIFTPRSRSLGRVEPEASWTRSRGRQTRSINSIVVWCSVQHSPVGMKPKWIQLPSLHM